MARFLVFLCMNRFTFVSSVLMVVLSSCTTLQTISFDHLQPASISYPEQIRRVGVVNAMPVMELDTIGKHSVVSVLEGDGILSAETLAQEVAATNYFDEVIICDSAIWKQSVPMQGPLPVAKVDSLIQTLDVDMLLAMERVHIQLKEEVMFIPELMASVPAVEGVVTPLLRVYVAGHNNPLYTISKSDTLCWEKDASLTFGQIAKDASEYAATLPMKELLPYWSEIQRYYFDGGGTEMRDAGVHVREQKWEEAASLWKQVLEKKKGKAKMRAAFNLALYCEVQDDFDGARDYLDMAAQCVGKDSFEGQLIELYRMQLDALFPNIQALRLQMKRFE